jgi:hypothetical protein
LHAGVDFGAYVDDGDQHRTDRSQFVKDINRLAKFADLGWGVIRVVAEHRPEDIVERTYQVLTRRGYRRDRHQRVPYSNFPALASIPVARATR